jgi:hypothetical protein
MNHPLAPETEQLLQNLQPEQDFNAARAAAARRLGQLETSDLRVVEALIAAFESDPAPTVRKEAAGSLQAPAHQAVLQQQPELVQKVCQLQAAASQATQASVVSMESLPLSPEIEQLLLDLYPQRGLDAVRALAARRLGQLSTSDLRVVEALIITSESDPTPAVRQEAAESLRAPAHQAILQQHPGLIEKVRQAPAGQAATLPTAQKARPEQAVRTKPQPSIQSPWLSIWIEPRGTIRQIVDSNPERHVLLLAVLTGVYRALDNAAARDLGDSLSLPAIFILSLIFGAIGGMISLYITGAVFTWSGNLFGGEASSEEVRTAAAWSSVPDVVLLVVLLFPMAVLGREWFSSSPDLPDNALIGLWLLGLVGIGIVLTLWRVFLFVKCLAEVHNFSAWRGLAASIVGVLALGVTVFVLFFACNTLAS